jgi:hypothetical protein
MKPYAFVWRFFLLPRHWRFYSDIESRSWNVFPSRSAF